MDRWKILREVRLQRFDLTGGSDRVQLELGRPAGEVPVNVLGGLKTLRLERPKGSALSLVVQGGAGRVEFDGKSLGGKGGETTIESPGWSTARDRYGVKVIGGAKVIEVVER